jgi:DNA polymerase-3 subunit beta
MNAALSIALAPTLLAATLDRRALAQALSRLKSIVATRSAVPALEAVLLSGTDDALLLTATDASVVVRAAVPANVSSSWATLLVPLRRLLEVTRGPSAPLELLGDQIVTGGATHRLATLPTASFPVVLPPSGPVLFTLMRPTLARLLRQTATAMSHDDTRPHLASMLIERRRGELVFVATDGHRLAKAIVADEGDDFSALVGRRTIEAVERMVAVNGGLIRLRRDGDRLWFVSGDEWVSGPVVDAVFPSYEQVIPAASAGHVTLDRAELQAAVRTLAARGDGGVSIKLDREARTATLTSRNDAENLTEMTLAATLDGAPPTGLGLNGRYLRELVAALSDDDRRVTLGLNGELDPICLHAHGATFVVMPMRI